MNGSNVGSGQDTYTSTTLADGNVVTCEMTSSDPCAGISNRIYVPPTGTGNSSTWANATSDLQAAIDNPCDVTEIWISAGTYKPAAYPTGCTTCTIPREYAFMIKDNINIYGGFAGTETMLSERTPCNETILSCDVDNNDTWDDGNAYHILIALNVSGVALDGLTIQHRLLALQDGFPTDATDDGSNLYLDPLFTDAASNDCTLISCSPAISTGNNTAVSATDLAGNTRIRNGTVDMGAYEKATTAVGEIECITFGGFTTCNGDMAYVNEDDFAPGSVTVKFSSIPSSGTLDLSSSALVGTASVDVSALSGNSYTFNNVKLLATGQEAEVTASFSDNSGSASEMIATPLPCSRYIFTGTGNWDVPTNWQDNNQPATSGNNRHFTYLGDAVVYPGMSFSSIGDSVVIEMDGSLDIQQSVTFSKSTANTGGFENNGTVTLTGNGTARYFFPLYNNSDFTIAAGTDDFNQATNAFFTNSGTVTNNGTVVFGSFPTLTNEAGGTFNNMGTMTHVQMLSTSSSMHRIRGLSRT